MIKFRKRRGMSSIMETVISMTLFAMILVVLMHMMAYSNEWNMKAQQDMGQKIDIDYLVDVLEEDVKSSTNIELVDDKLQIVSPTKVTLYSRFGAAIYRDSEEVISNVVACSFSTLDGDSVRVYVQTEDNDIIDLTIHR